jgi:hypothetical protein
VVRCVIYVRGASMQFNEIAVVPSTAAAAAVMLTTLSAVDAHPAGEVPSDQRLVVHQRGADNADVRLYCGPNCRIEIVPFLRIV